jgi:hypothetical protein
MSDEAVESAGERRLLAHLEQLRAARLEPSHELAPSVVRSARGQRALRANLSAAGGHAGAAADAARMSFASRGRP